MGAAKPGKPNQTKRSSDWKRNTVGEFRLMPTLLYLRVLTSDFLWIFLNRFVWILQGSRFQKQTNSSILPLKMTLYKLQVEDKKYYLYYATYVPKDNLTLKGL